MPYQQNITRFPPSTIIVMENKPAGEMARAMIESGHQKESFYIFDFDAAYENVQKFKEALPRVQIFYAMKSNDYSMMVKLAIALGLGFDCASPEEINKIRRHNVRATSIIYAAPTKTPEQMVFARQSGVRHTTFDSICELRKLQEYWPDCRSLIRIKLDSDSVYKLGDKFGCDYAEAVQLLDEAARLGVTVIGVAFHVGSGCFTKQAYTEGLRIARALFDHEIHAGRNMTLLDIGGGFFNDGTNRFDEVAHLIKVGLAKWFPEPNIQIIAEPGRYICESAFTLYSSIRNIRTVVESNRTMNFLYINNGIHGSLRFIEKWHTMSIFKRTRDIGLTKDDIQDTIIWGPTLDDGDFLGPVKLPSCSVDDWLVFYHQGAYCKVFKSKFCCVEENFTRSVISEHLWTSLKSKPVFSSCAFVLEITFPPLLPSTLPPIHFNRGKQIINEQDYVIDFKSHVTPAYVLEHHTPDDVARAMIESGQQAQPFYIFSMDKVWRRVQHFKEMMPRVNIFYAVRSNDTEVMLRLVAALGLNFNCVSPGEIHKVRKLNVNPQRIIYAMPCKTLEEMEYARQAEVKHTTFDTSYELKKIKASWPDARLLIRIAIGSAKFPLGSKFGCNFETEARKLLDEAADLKLKVVGVAFHVGSSGHFAESYSLGLQYAKSLFDHEARNGRRMDVVDIGGGFLSDKTDNIDKVSYLINSIVEELFPDPAIQIIAEPGRYLCDSAFKMFCSVMGVRKVIRNNLPVNMLYLNNGFYGTLRFIQTWQKIYKFQRSPKPESILNEETILWGPTCDSIDRVMQDYKIHLPQCSPDDWLVVDIHGAYTFTFSTRFSSLEIPLIRPVISKNLWNRVKTSTVYQSSDFIRNTNISTPLPSLLPPVLSNNEKYEHTDIPVLKI